MDDYEWVNIVFYTVAPLLQILVPMLHSLVAAHKGKSPMRILSIHAYTTFIFWLTYLSACRSTQCAKYGKVFGNMVIMAFVMIPLSYAFMLLESCFSSESKYISNLMKDESASEYINTLQRATPTRQLLVECWHLETRTRTVTYTDASGNLQTRTETYQEVVITHTETQDFPIGYSRDISDSAGPKFDSYSVTRLKLSQEVSCGDAETLQKFEEMQEDMLLRNQGKDVNVSFSHQDVIPGFKKRLCAYTDIHMKPCWMNTGCFWLAALFGLGWPFRWLFRWKTKKADYTVRKEIYLHRPQNEDVSNLPINQPALVLQDGISLVDMTQASTMPYPNQPPIGMPPPPYPLQGNGDLSQAPATVNSGFM